MHTALFILLSILQFQGPISDSHAGSPAISGPPTIVGPPAIAGAPAVSETVAADPEILVLVELVNRRRSDLGCAPLTWHDGIAAVATAHSIDMQKRDFYDHVNPDGETLMHRLARAGIAFNGVAGENLVIGTVDGTIAYTLWIDSPKHRAIIENCAFTHHGVGLADGRWTHLFVQRPLH
jgi:uncharacterized protein YkwD